MSVTTAGLSAAGAADAAAEMTAAMSPCHFNFSIVFLELVCNLIALCYLITKWSSTCCLGFVETSFHG